MVNKYLGIVKFLNTLTIAVGDDQSVMTHHSSKDYTALYRRFANFYTLFCAKSKDDLNLKSCNILFILKMIPLAEYFLLQRLYILKYCL